jgi:hypothetical protein
VKSFIKIYGPPILKAIKALERIAIKMPTICIMDTLIASAQAYVAEDWAMDYFSPLGEISVERCGNIISKSGESLGRFDFFFEWFGKPDQKQVNDLIEKIDGALKPLGCKYTITTKE